MGNRAYVTTQSIKKLRKHLKEWALDPEGWSLSGNSDGGVRHQKKINLNDIHPDDKRTYYKERWINEDDLEQRFIVTFSPKHKRYQQAIRERQIDRAIRKIERSDRLDKKGPNDTARFIQSTHVTTEGKVTNKTKQ